MRKLHRLHLKVLLLRPGHPNPNGFYIAGLSISVLLTQSILCQAHYKTYSPEWTLSPPPAVGNMFYGGPGGHCPRVLNPFLSTSYSLNLHYILISGCCQPISVP